MLGLCIGWLYMIRYLGAKACCQTRGSNPLWQAELKLLLTAEIKILIITWALLCIDPAGEHPTMCSVSATYLEINESWGFAALERCSVTVSIGLKHVFSKGIVAISSSGISTLCESGVNDVKHCSSGIEGENRKRTKCFRRRLRGELGWWLLPSHT